mgnify:FL=1
MKKIVRGNDFTLRIPVRKIVGGQMEKFPLPACEEVEVNLVNAFRRRTLAYSICVDDDSLIEATVRSSEMALGAYALEVRGKLFGCSWRSNEYEQIMLVDNNANGDTAFGEVIEGEDSVEMDTAIVVLPPNVELGKLIESAGEAIVKVDAKLSEVDVRIDKAVGDAGAATLSANAAAGYANEQGDRAKAQADHPNIIGADGYWMRWDEKTGAYVRTDHYSKGSFDYPTFDVVDGKLIACITEGDTDRFKLSEDGHLLVAQN